MYACIDITGESIVKQQIIGVALFVATGISHAQSYGKAEMLLDHGLTTEAQKELIDLVFSERNSPDKPKALNLLASIAVDKNNLHAAIDAWGRLIRIYPSSPEAVAARNKLPLLTSVLGQVSEEVMSDATARVLLRNADFWSKGRDKIFLIDGSWIDNLEAAVFWYDTVIAGYKGTTAARIAYEDKMRTLLGWEGSGRFDKAVPGAPVVILEETFREYEKAFPQAAAQQAFRFQVAQAYWRAKNWVKTREMLTEIIDKDGGANSFYKDLAERRLKKVEH